LNPHTSCGFSADIVPESGRSNSNWKAVVSVEMDKEHASIVFSAEIRDIVSYNSSFDKGVLRVCHTGKNNNLSYISKDTLESCIDSIYNCPVVCHYDRDTDTIGGHDVELVHTKDGGLRMVNVTNPVGVVPSGAKHWYEEIEDSTATHEYLCVDILLWKRQEAYEKIRRDGVTSESMEINILASHKEDEILCIDRLEFTAFCLLGTVKPCFESAAVTLFALDEFKAQMSDMMEDLRASFSTVQPETVDIDTQMEGGKTALDNEKEVQVEEPVEEVTVEEVEPAAEEPAADPVEETADPVAETADPAPAEEPAAEIDEEPAEEAAFALAGQLVDSLFEALSAVTVQREWGECPRYWFVDYDPDLSEVYANDTEDWKLYGFTYTVSGDVVTIDFASKSRKKWTISDFIDGEDTAVFAQIGKAVENALNAQKEAFSQERDGLTKELNTLRDYKTETEAAEVFSQFTELNGIEAFDELCKNYSGLTREQLEEKCYAIKGRHVSVDAKFSAAPKSVRVVVETGDAVEDEPYGGLFQEFS